MNSKNIKHQLDAITKEIKGTKPKIVAYGLMNAGKSSLLNTLTQHVEEEYFKTNDVRETATNKQFEADKYIYIDTPGLDASEQDDLHAQYGAEQADIVLFVHQPQGELEVKEMHFLKSLKSSFGECAGNNIIIVLNKIDKEVPEKIHLIEQRIQQQCEREIDFSPTFFQVSSKRYQAGVRMQKDGLIAESYIDALKAHLQVIAASVSEVRAQRTLTKVDELWQAVDQAKKQLQSRKTQLHAQINTGFSSFNEQLEQLRSFIDKSTSNFENI